MSQRLDVKKVETALKEAAVKATYGSDDERSGRFLPVESSVMTTIEYDEDTAELDITFTGGKTYRYRDVPVEIYADLLDAKSKGQFFNERIKKAFPFAAVSRGRKSRIHT